MKAEIIQSLMDWNSWQQGDFPIELLGFSRDYHLLDYLQVPEIKIIEGARRVGKSTLLYQVIHTVFKTNKKLLYINFEDEALKKYSLTDIVYTYLEHAEIDYLFVDEIQNCAEWVSFTRKAYDRQEFKQIWISGSNSSLIKQEYASLLTGRNLAIHIYPLSFHEFLHFKDYSISKLPLSKNQRVAILKLFAEYLEYGAFPAVVNRSILKKELLLAYFNDFIYKDIVSRYNVDPEKIKELAIYLATQTTKQFSYRNIAKMLNCHINTVTDYLSYLQSVFLFDEIYKFDYSLKNQIVNDKKIYCIDSGIAAAVSFRFSEEKGRTLENIVYCELRRRQLQIFFHKQKYECDFIIKTELKISSAIQVTFSLEDAETKAREIKGLLEALETYELTTGTILTYDEEYTEKIIINAIERTIFVVPVWKYLLQSYS